MSATIVELADAILADLNAAGGSSSDSVFDQSFIATRSWKPEFTLEQITATAAVVVVPAGEGNEILTRAGELSVTYQIDVGVLKGISLAENSEVDALVYLVQQIGDFYKATRRPTGRRETFIGAQFFLPDEEFLRKRKFVGIARLSFRGMR